MVMSVKTGPYASGGPIRLRKFDARSHAAPGEKRPSHRPDHLRNFSFLVTAV